MEPKYFLDRRYPKERENGMCKKRVHFTNYDKIFPFIACGVSTIACGVSTTAYGVSTIEQSFESNEIMQKNFTVTP